MFGRFRKGKGKISGIIAGIIAFGLGMSLFSRSFLLFGTGIFGIIFLAVFAFIVGKIVSVMAKGLDLTTHNRKKPYEYGEENEPDTFYTTGSSVSKEEPAAEKPQYQPESQVNEAAATNTAKDKAPNVQEIPLTGNAAADEVIAKGQQVLLQIRAENDAIADRKLSSQMDELEKMCSKIFQTISEKPEKVNQVRKFMNYYLPTTLKILANYRTMDTRGVSASEMRAIHSDTSRCLDMVLTACQKQLDNLYKDNMLDIFTDMDVLEQMMKRDGYMDSDINIKETASNAGTAAAAHMERHQAPILEVEDSTNQDYTKRSKTNAAE